MNTAIQEKQEEVKEKQQELVEEIHTQSIKQEQKHNKLMQQVSRASNIIDTPVKNSSGDNLGEIKDLVLDPFSGQMVYAVIAFGGTFGFGDKLFAIPWRALHWSHDHEHYTLNVEKSSLENAPGFDKNHWPDNNRWNVLREELEHFYYDKL